MPEPSQFEDQFRVLLNRFSAPLHNQDGVLLVGRRVGTPKDGVSDSHPLLPFKIESRLLGFEKGSNRLAIDLQKIVFDCGRSGLFVTKHVNARRFGRCGPHLRVAQCAERKKRDQESTRPPHSWRPQGAPTCLSSLSSHSNSTVASDVDLDLVSGLLNTCIAWPGHFCPPGSSRACAPTTTTALFSPPHRAPA